MFTTKYIVARSKTAHNTRMHIFSPSSDFACFQLVCFPSKHKERGSLERHKSQYHPSAAFFENQPLTNYKTSPSNFHRGSVSNTPSSISWAPNEHALILRNSPSHQSRQKELGEGICPFPGLACCCIQKQRIYLSFAFFPPKQRLSQTRKRSMAWNDVTNYAIPRPFSVILWLGRVLKKCHFSNL